MFLSKHNYNMEYAIVFIFIVPLNCYAETSQNNDAEINEITLQLDSYAEIDEIILDHDEVYYNDTFVCECNFITLFVPGYYIDKNVTISVKNKFILNYNNDKKYKIKDVFIGVPEHKFNWLTLFRIPVVDNSFENPNKNDTIIVIYLSDENECICIRTYQAYKSYAYVKTKNIKDNFKKHVIKNVCKFKNCIIKINLSLEYN